MIPLQLGLTPDLDVHGVPTLQTLGAYLRDRRGDVGIRATAAAIGISPATLSRFERGHKIDLVTFGKICRWGELDPSAVLGIRKKQSGQSATTHPARLETAADLAKLILSTQRSIRATAEPDGSESDWADTD